MKREQPWKDRGSLFLLIWIYMSEKYIIDKKYSRNNYNFGK